MKFSINNAELLTYSSFEKKQKVVNSIVSRNPLNIVSNQALIDITFRILPPNIVNQYLDLKAHASSLRVYYLPLILSRFISIIGSQEASLSTINALNDIKEGTQGMVYSVISKKSLYSFELTIDSPVAIVPILKNNDLSSPCWAINFGDLHFSSKVRKNLKMIFL